jgi:MarC family membrane protein
MTLSEIAFLLFVVVDPIGNLPLVQAILGQLSGPDYRRVVTREVLIATCILAGFALTGGRVLAFLGVEQSSLRVAGGVILFLISLKMIFKTSAAIFENGYRDDPLLVPIAVPAVAGPSAITTLIILGTQGHAGRPMILAALALVMVLTYLTLLFGRMLSRLLEPRGISALEKLMGLLLNLIAVNMILAGVRSFLCGVG